VTVINFVTVAISLHRNKQCRNSLILCNSVATVMMIETVI